MLYLLLIPLLTQALVIHETDCVNYWCKYYLHFYLQGLNTSFESRKEANAYIIKITQFPPPIGIASLYMNVYTISSEGMKMEVTRLFKHRIDNSVEITIHLLESEINNIRRCSYIGIFITHMEYECIFSIEYTSRIQHSPVKIYIYKMVVEVPILLGFVDRVRGHLIEERVSRFIEAPQYEVRMYRGMSCNQKITSLTIVEPQEYIRMCVFDIDITRPLRHLDVTFLVATYISRGLGIRSFDMLRTADIMSSFNGRIAIGRVCAVLQMTHVGSLKISMVITSRERQRTRIESPDGIEVRDSSWWLNDPFLPGSATSVVVSLITFLCLLVAL